MEIRNFSLNNIKYIIELLSTRDRKLRVETVILFQRSNRDYMKLCESVRYEKGQHIFHRRST